MLCRYSLMLAGIGDGSGSGDCAIMNALVNVMRAQLRNAHVSRQVENLKQTETIAKRNALDDIEKSLCRFTRERLLVCGRLTMVAGSRGMRLGSSDSEEAVRRVADTPQLCCWVAGSWLTGVAGSVGSVGDALRRGQAHS